jgi:hypothetical protein
MRTAGGLASAPAPVHHSSMRSLRILTVALLPAGLGASLGSGAALSAPPGIALVVSNISYTALPLLPACALSARAVSAAFKARGYDVSSLTDRSAGQLDGALAQLSDKLRAIPDAPVVIYFCGYVAGHNGRPFLVPVSAALERPSDIMTQGILAKFVVEAAANVGSRPALVVLEAVTVPNAAEPMGLGSLDRPDLPPGLGLLAATVSPGDSSLRLVTSLIPHLKAESVTIADVIDGIKKDPDGPAGAGLVLGRASSEPAYLIGSPPPAPTPPAPPLPPEPAPVPVPTLVLPPPALASVVEPTPAPAPATVAATAIPKVIPQPPPAVEPLPAPTSSAATVALGEMAPVPAPPPSALPDEDRMTDAMRRSVQIKLTALGYYGGPIDGIFATETRVAIRRLQHEFQVPMTGRLTGAQAGKLMTLH